MPAPEELYFPPDKPLTGPSGAPAPDFWRFIQDLILSLQDIDLSTQVSGILSAANGGTGVAYASPILLKHQRVTTGVIVAGTSSTVTLTWTAPFADTDYTVVASVVDATAATASLSVVHIETVSASAVVVRIANAAGGNLTGTLDVVAFHD